MGTHERISSRERVAKRRAAMRAQGLRPKQIWVPDLRDPAVQERLREQARSLAGCPQEKEYLAWVLSISAEALEDLDDL
jgi:hypothetical protein